MAHLYQLRVVAVALLVFVVLGLGASPSAQAQPTMDADKLFSDGLALMGDEKYEDALRKLEQAEALDPGIGTQFNIGICYEKLGKLGTAWRNYADVQQLAHASGKTAREENARHKLEELRPRLSRFVFGMAEGNRAVDLTIKVDGLVVPRAEWTGYPVDPGTHRIDAMATARTPWNGTADAPASGAELAIDVPALASSKETKVVTVTQETTNNRRTVGIVFGSVGVAGLVVATVTGILMLNDHATAERVCKPRCLNADGTSNQDGIDAVDQGRTLSPMNVAAWIVAGAGLGVGAYLILTSTKRVRPVVDPHAAGLVFSGTL